MRKKFQIQKVFVVAAMLCAAKLALAGDWSGGPGGEGDDRPPPPPESGDTNKGQGGHRGGGRGHGPGGHAEIEACASSLGITITKGTKPSEENRNSIRECMEAKRAVIDSCLKAAGVAFGEDGRPSTRPTREQMESCRKSVSTDSSTTSSAL